MLSFDGTEVNYDILPGGRHFLVFLHGIGGDLKVWSQERHYFHRHGYSTLAIDLRGHGLSGRPKSPSDYNLECFARDLWEIIRKESVDSFSIIGHCFGGMVALMFEKIFPDLAASYVLIDCACKAPIQLHEAFRDHPFFVHLLNSILERKDLHSRHFSHVDPKAFAGTGEWNLLRIFSDIAHTSLKSWIFTYESLSKFNGISSLKNLNRPALIIEGASDSIIPVFEAYRMKKFIRNSILEIIPKENHIIVLNNPKVIEKEIYSFIINQGL